MANRKGCTYSGCFSLFFRGKQFKDVSSNTICDCASYDNNDISNTYRYYHLQHVEIIVKFFLLDLPTPNTFLHSFPPGCVLVVPLERRQLVALHGSEGVDDVRTQVEWDILREKLSPPVPVLRPVGVVTYAAVRQGCRWSVTIQ